VLEGSSEAGAGGAQGQSMLRVSIAGAPDARRFERRIKWGAAASYAAPRPVPSRTFSVIANKGSFTLQVRAIGASGIGPWFEASALFGGGNPGGIRGYDDGDYSGLPAIP
jgi:hypothetical protein